MSITPTGTPTPSPILLAFPWRDDRELPALPGREAEVAVEKVVGVMATPAIVEDGPCAEAVCLLNEVVAVEEVLDAIKEDDEVADDRRGEGKITPSLERDVSLV